MCTKAELTYPKTKFECKPIKYSQRDRKDSRNKKRGDGARGQQGG